MGEGLTGRIAASFENDNGEYFEGHIGTSLTDNLAVRLAVMDRSIDGYNDNNAPNAANPNMPQWTKPLPELVSNGSPQVQCGHPLYVSDFLRTAARVRSQRCPTLWTALVRSYQLPTLRCTQ